MRRLIDKQLNFHKLFSWRENEVGCVNLFNQNDAREDDSCDDLRDDCETREADFLTTGLPQQQQLCVKVAPLFSIAVEREREKERETYARHPEYRSQLLLAHTLHVLISLNEKYRKASRSSQSSECILSFCVTRFRTCRETAYGAELNKNQLSLLTRQGK